MNCLITPNQWCLSNAVRANIIAAAVSVVLIRGVRIGLVRRVRLGVSCEAAVSKLFAELPRSRAAHLIVVDAGIATQEQLAAATHGNSQRPVFFTLVYSSSPSITRLRN